MISVCVKQDAEGIRMIDVSGHAMQAPHGEDLVCAGVSCIMTGALNALDIRRHVTSYWRRGTFPSGKKKRMSRLSCCCRPY